MSFKVYETISRTLTRAMYDRDGMTGLVEYLPALAVSVHEIVSEEGFNETFHRPEPLCVNCRKEAHFG